MYFVFGITGYDNRMIPCVERDGKYYISVYKYYTNQKGHVFKHNLQYEFGKYYNALISVMNSEYEVEKANGTAEGYGLIKIDKFVEAIKSVWESEVQ